jgi:hypothetical protein
VLPVEPEDKDLPMVGWERQKYPCDFPLPLIRDDYVER